MKQEIAERAQRLADAVEAARKRGLPTKEVARRANVHEQSIYKAMAGPGVGIKVAIRLGPVLGVSASWLAGVDPDQRPTTLPLSPPVPQKVREWGEWMRDLDGDIRRLVTRVGDALQAASKASAARTTQPPGTTRRSTRARPVAG